jgi:hypothetical protein
VSGEAEAGGSGEGYEGEEEEERGKCTHKSARECSRECGPLFFCGPNSRVSRTREK